MFALLFSAINVLLYHYPFYIFVNSRLDILNANGFILLISLILCALLLNALVFYIGLYVLRKVGKGIIALFFIINAIAIYFINTYGVILDRSMIGNVVNTNYEESSAFMSIGLVVYLFLLGVLPSFFLFKIGIVYVSVKRFCIHIFLTLVVLLTIAYANSPNWLWVDKNSKTLGGLVMPWSYVVNTVRFYNHKNKSNQKQLVLPDAKIKNTSKSVVVLVIGESARSSNFSLYGYGKETNPLLSKIENLHNFTTQSCATYTTAGLKCILEHKNTNRFYEILPNYLYRNGVDVIWKTTNWGEPEVTVPNFQNKQKLRNDCDGYHCDYDEILLNDLENEIITSTKDKILIVLHTSTSHGPTYYKKYPKAFENFTPVCKSVELADCTEQELINAYDNTILYTDYILANVISRLQTLEEYQSAMLFISDHGESLGENNLYMHGIPASLAPKEQLDIPFIVWQSSGSRALKTDQDHSQHNVFHSVLDFLAVDSPIFDEEMSIYEK